MINFSYSTHLADGYVPYCLSLKDFSSVLVSKGNYSPFQYNNNYRKEINSNLDKCNCIMLDFDDGMSIDEAKLLFNQYKNIIATTKSKKKKKNGIICDRFRLILPTNRVFENISIDEYKMMMQILINRYGSDNATKDIARFYYACEYSEVEINENGFLFDIDVLHKQALYYFNKQKEIKEKEKEIKKGVNLNMINKQYENSCQTKKEWFYKFSHTQQMLDYFEFSSRFGAGGRNKYLFGVAKHLEEEGCDNEFIKSEIFFINSSGDGISETEIEKTIFRSMKL